MSRLLLAAVATCLMLAPALAQEGARAYFLLPDGTDTLSLNGRYLYGEQAGFERHATVITPSYRRTFDLGGNAAAFLIGVPIGSLEVDTGILGVREAGPTYGDFFIGGEIGLVGSPSLSPVDYAQYQPGFRLGAAAKLFLPTGEYDAAEPVNFGRNRWSLQASLPISYVLADSMLDPDLTTFEIIPSVQIFGDNDAAFGGDIESREPLFALEAHVTRTFSPTIWGALDGYLKTGGETSVDGVVRSAEEKTLALGATLGIVLTQAVSLRMSYLEQVYSKVPDSVDRAFELNLSYRF
jgi:hypothetical protein